jgi:DNA polymerase-3 subunit epsilon
MNLLFLDTETGGLDPLKHSLLQVGVIAYKDKGIVDKFEFKLKHEVYNVNPFAMEINQLNLSDIDKNGFTLTGAVTLLNDFISRHFKDDKPVLVGHNVSFDKEMVRHQLYKANGFDINDFISHRQIDTMSLIWGLHFAGRLPIEACSSSGAFKYFGIKVDKRHDALDDCCATVELYEKLIDLMRG